MDKKNTAVVTVLGNDYRGIIAKVSAVLAERDANILDISQTVLSGMRSTQSPSSYFWINQGAPVMISCQGVPL